MDKRVNIIWKSLFLTVLIFGFAILFNHFLDFTRINVITDVIAEHEIERDAYLTEQAFVETFSEYGCSILKKRFTVLKNEIVDVGKDLGTYSKSSWFKQKDFDYLKRKYFLLEFELLTLVHKLNDMCGHPYLPILFFYEIGDDASERQGFILDDLSKVYNERVVVLSVDKDYKDEPIVNTIVEVFNITKAPTIIIGSTKLEGVVYTDELNASIRKELSLADPYGKKHDLDFTVKATGENSDSLVKLYQERLKRKIDSFARADLLFLIGRLTKNDSLICSALVELDKVNSTSTNHEEKALVYETIASIDCGRNKAAFYNLAAEEWEKAGKKWRAYIDYVLSEGDMPKLKFKPMYVEPDLVKGNYSKLILGKSKIVVDNSTNIVVQTDRVTRDWLSGMIQNPFKGVVLKVFSEKSKDKVSSNIAWHEGGRLHELLKVGAKHKIAAGTLIAKKDTKWFAPDENGIFRFEVPIDKVLYPTTRFLRKDLAVIIDTHGINMLVDQAVSNNADLVIGCGDHPAKAAAAKYLSDKGISVVSFPDKFFYLLLGHDTNVLGSPPINIKEDNVIFGNRPLEISIKDKLVVSNSSNDIFALWYYQAPEHYFSEIAKFIPLDIKYFSFDSFGSQPDLVDFAEKNDATVIASRVYNKADYSALAGWLKKDDKRKVILLHSSPYPYGIKLFNDFSNQTSFGDPNPVFE